MCDYGSVAKFSQEWAEFLVGADLGIAIHRNSYQAHRARLLDEAADWVAARVRFR
ncbi:MAG: hypothetical protein ACLP01_02845 [Solirubrobacteraceae bacterium]